MIPALPSSRSASTSHHGTPPYHRPGTPLPHRHDPPPPHRHDQPSPHRPGPPPTLVLACLCPIGPAYLHPMGPARWVHAPHPGPPQVQACLRPTSGTPLPHRPGSPLPHLPGTLPPHRPGPPPPLIPARPRAPDSDATRLRPSARSASAAQPASRSNCKSFHPIPAGIIRDEDSTRTRTETLAAFPGINCMFPWCEQPHTLV
jgi:hypothetical protein